MPNFGLFPFGRPNTKCPARMVEGAAAAVVGVYPSALHVQWTAPSELFADGKEHGVAALAVDVEPTVFWDGLSPSFEALVARWKKKVGFVDGRHGKIGARSPGTNGSSGAKVVAEYLAPLGLDPARTMFTDVYPVFFVKGGGRVAKPGGQKKRREQGDAILAEYGPVAAKLRLPACSLPKRPSPKQLPGLAAEKFKADLIGDLERSRAPLVITLGKEVWETFVAVEELQANPPCDTFDGLDDERYGAAGSIVVGGRKVKWLPLVHPGLLRGKAAEGERLGWIGRHQEWVRGRRK